MYKLYTIGHSTHTLEEFIALLQHYHISLLVDIRAFPQSRRVPWFNKSQLSLSLSPFNISYQHLSSLGGLRPKHKESINTGWRNSSFRAFADYMQTPDFFTGLKELNQFIRANQAVAIMCAEAVPWRCHRSLVADAETVRGIDVYHIINKQNANLHELTPFAAVDKSRRPVQLYYPKK